MPTANNGHWTYYRGDYYGTWETGGSIRVVIGGGAYGSLANAVGEDAAPVVVVALGSVAPLAFLAAAVITMRRRRRTAGGAQGEHVPLACSEDSTQQPEAQPACTNPDHEEHERLVGEV